MVLSGVPLLPCAAYALFRWLLDDSLCWALPAESNGWIEWIYMIPGKLLCCVVPERRPNTFSH